VCVCVCGTWRASSRHLAWKSSPNPQTQRIQPCSVSCWWGCQSSRPAEPWMQRLSLLWTLCKQKRYCKDHCLAFTMMLDSLAERYEHFRRAYHFHLQGRLPGSSATIILICLNSQHYAKKTGSGGPYGLDIYRLPHFFFFFFSYLAAKKTVMASWLTCIIP
jgi:hypothetical protein